MRAAVLALVLTLSASATPPTCTVMPGFTQEGEVRHFDTETLFEYMNGNSEGYFLYGFESMEGITCAKGEVKLIFDVSTFVDFESAYGMFTGNADPRAPILALGAGAQVTPRKAVLVKDRYYVEIAAEPDADHSEVLQAAITRFETQIAGRTERPPELGWFPAEGIQPGFPRLAPQSVLGLRLLKRGYLAQYANGKAFVVSEASPADAASLMKKLRERFPPSSEAKIGEEAFIASDRYLGNLCFFRKGNRVAGWANVKDADAGVLAAALASRLP
jgi:hypothetical protein